MSKKIYGGWQSTEKLKNGVERPIVEHVKCEAPNMKLYLDNFKARRAAR